jgi:Ni/Co efflux regulator RcnB
MARILITIAAVAASVATTLVPTIAMAHDQYDGWTQERDQHYGGDRDWRHQRDYTQGDAGRDYGRYDRRGYYGNGYADRGYYADTGYHQGYDARAQYRVRCHSDGSTGTIIGAIAGGLLGHGIAGRGDRTLGAILGGGAGAFAGRAIERSGNRC